MASDKKKADGPAWWEIVLIIPLILLTTFGIALGLIVGPIWIGLKIGISVVEEYGENGPAGRGNG
jgi:uncharacterized membrane protein YhaH (DUF805 family)